MRHKTGNGNIYSSDNIDPSFLEYLYNLPAEFLEELFIAWVITKSNNIKIPIASIPVIDIDSIHNKKARPISNKEIGELYNKTKMYLLV